MVVPSRRRHPDMSGILTRSTVRPRPPGATVPRLAPWNSLNGVVSGDWGANVTVPGYSRPLLSSVPYNHAANGQCCAAVADQLGSPPVQPGDALMLMSGNYGDIVIGDFNLPTTNSDFVTVDAAPGQVPVFSTLSLDRTNKWVFSGVKVQSLLGTNGNSHALVTITDQGPLYPTTDLVLENLQISSADSTAGWTKAQWIAQARSGVRVAGSLGSGADGEPYTSCISVTGSHIQNVRFGAVLAGNNLLFTNNVIDHFGDDGLQYGANNLAITHNTIHDNLDIGDGNHEDAMQGYYGPIPSGIGFLAFSNIVFDSNRIVRQEDPNNPFPTYLQGIDAFDDDWTNMTVTNNVIITSACHGITFESIHNSLIANNTVVEDGLFPTPGCVAAINVGGATHQGPLSTNTAVRNNLTSRLYVDTRNSGVVPDHNVAMCCTGPEISWYVNGVIQYNSKVGAYTNGNIIDAGGANAEFVNFNPSSITYNVMLKATAQVIGAGTAGSPTVDILGVKRAAPYTAGAYSYPF